MAVLRQLATDAALTLATTHHGRLKSLKYQEDTAGAFENACVEFDVATMAPTYRLLWGVPGRSNALAIAERLGLPGGVVEDARALLEEDGEVRTLISTHRPLGHPSPSLMPRLPCISCSCSPPVDAHSQGVMEIDVPRDAVGKLIGTRGKVINQIRDLTHAEIRLAKDDEGNGTLLVHGLGHQLDQVYPPTAHTVPRSHLLLHLWIFLHKFKEFTLLTWILTGLIHHCLCHLRIRHLDLSFLTQFGQEKTQAHAALGQRIVLICRLNFRMIVALHVRVLVMPKLMSDLPCFRFHQ